MTTSQSVDADVMTPQEYGVGARFTLSVYDSDYISIILEALNHVDHSDLMVDTGDISTFATGSEQRVLTYLRDVIAAAARRGVHVSASILLSRGCPGELQCELPPGVAALGAKPVELEPTGQRARAHWSLYPLIDAAPADGDHMALIYEAIEGAKRDGVYSGSDHFATRLDGDLAKVLEAAANTWIAVGSRVQHVVTHVTVSMNSPTLAE